MFQDLNLSLQNLLKGLAVDFAFDAPDQKFAARQFAHATLNLFLYEISENRELRNPAPTATKTSDGKVNVQRPPLRVDCCYLATAWAPQDATDPASVQLELLGSAFIQLCSVPSIDPASPVLVGSLQNSPYPVRLQTAQLSQHRSPREVWTALGIPMRSAFHLIATIAAPTSAPTIFTQVKTGEVQYTDLTSTTPNTPIVKIPLVDSH